jgi:voltage-gated potassium channel
MNFFTIIWSFLRDDNYRKLLITTSGIILIGTIIFHKIEGWSIIDAMYFTVITLTTVGYGDFSPQTTGGKIFAIVYIFVGIGIILNFIQVAFEHFKNEGGVNKK